MTSRSLTLLTGAFMFLFFHSYAQSFEGVITMRVSDFPDNSTTVKIKDDKTVTEYVLDSTESVRIIKDAGAETQTILRRKNELKYGFLTTLYNEADIHALPEENKKPVTCELPAEKKMIGEYQCFKAILRNDNAYAETWITKNIDFPLSKYIPIFLGDGTDPDLLELRKKADQMGFIMEYAENLTGSKDKTHIVITVEEKEIPLEDFATHGYIVLDKEGMTRLSQESYADPNKKKQWDEYRQLFGKKD